MSGAADRAAATLVISPFLRPRTFRPVVQRGVAVLLKVGTGDFALATGHRLNAVSLVTGRSSSGTPQTIYLK
jgi:hypothetical protein